jgi:E3 ubiquitin-protein ligase TRIP12
MIKAKAKADRAAARQANASVSSTSRTMTVSALAFAEGLPASDALMDQSESQTQNDEIAPSPPQKEPSIDRTELLRSKPAVVDRFMQLIVPILTDVYAASVATPVRVKSLTGLLKAVSFMDGDGIKRVLKVCCGLCMRS